MSMRKFAELGHVYRTEPCEEYPGDWIVFAEGKVYSEGNLTFGAAHEKALRAVEEYDSKEQDFPINVSICWKCSDNDPRIGKVWFTGFYQHGKFNLFGTYKS